MRDHRSLQAWQEARAVVLGTIEVARTSWKPYAAAVFSQLQRASLSVQLNIAEGYAYADSPSFTRHLAIAYGSAVETGELLEVALDAEIVPLVLENSFLPGTSEASLSFSACLSGEENPGPKRPPLSAPAPRLP